MIRGMAAVALSGGVCGAARADVKALACAMPGLVAGFGAAEAGGRVGAGALVDTLIGREARDRHLEAVPSPGTVVLVSLGAFVMMRRRR